MGDLGNSLLISASGMRSQGERMKIIAENIANANSSAGKPGEDPYRRQLVIFRNELDREMGIRKVEVANVIPDKSAFQRRFMPEHPAADQQGYVQFPNVNTLIETMDMREAQRSFEANVSAIELARGMIMRTIELLRA